MSGAGYMLRGMTVTSRGSGALEASYSAGTAHFIPPAHPAAIDLEDWLEARTPPGAPTVTVLPPGARTPVRLPQVSRPVAPASPHRSRPLAAAVQAAYMHDIEGLSPRRLVISGAFDFTAERTARQHVRDGRTAAAALGAWPWAALDGQPLPRNWWADRHFALALQRWAIGELHPLAVGGAVHTLRPRRYTAAARLPVA